MFCQLKEAARIAPETIETIYKFFADSEHSPKRRVESPDRKERFSPLLSPPDENILAERRDERADDDGNDLAEQDTHIYGWIADSTSDPSESDTLSDVDFKWLKSCLIAASHDLDIIVLAAVQKFVVLQASHKVESKYEPIAWVKVDAESDDKPIYISSIYALCMASTRPVDSNSVDWTCICVGRSDGIVNFYTERGICIFYERAAHSSIRAIRFGASIYPGNQELVLLSAENKIVIFEGLLLFTVLKTARNQIAFGDKTLVDIVDSLQLNCHCLELDRLKHVSDVNHAGLIKPSSFDQYVTASCSAMGKHARVTRASLPTYNNYFCSSRQKFASFLWHHSEVSGSEILSDAIHSITSHITNSLPSMGIRSWLGIGVSRKDRPSKTCAADARFYRMPERNAICDSVRVAERCYMAPGGWPLIAVADSCARVLLIHTVRRQIIRIWKGYRGARCAWIESSSYYDINQKRHFNRIKAKALFLVIYAPKRGLLEVWSMENGPRVSAFKVNERGRLISIPPGKDATLLGTAAGEGAFGASSLYTTAAFINPCGTIMTLVVPFHLSALDVSVSTIHDDNLLKQFNITNVLKRPAAEMEDSGRCGALLEETEVLDSRKWLQFCANLKTPIAKRRFVEMLLCHVAACETTMSKNGDDDDDGNAKSNPHRLIPLGDILIVIRQMIDAEQKTNFVGITERKTSEVSRHPMSLLHYVTGVKTFLEILMRLRHMNTTLAEHNGPRFDETEKEIDYERLRRALRMDENDGEIFEQLNLALLRSTSRELVAPITHVLNLTKPSLKAFKDQFEFGGLAECSTSTNAQQSCVLHNGVTMVELRNVDELDGAQLGAMIFAPFLFAVDCDSGYSLESSNGLGQLFNEILPKINASIKTFVEVYVDFWLDSEWNIDPQLWTVNSTEILQGLFLKCRNENDRSSTIDCIEEKIFYSSNVHAALMMCLQLRSLHSRFIAVAGQTITGGSDVKRFKLDADGEQGDSNVSEASSFSISENRNPESTGERSKSAADAIAFLSERNDRKRSDAGGDHFMVIDEEEVRSTWRSAEDAEWLDLLTRHLAALSLLQSLLFICGRDSSDSNWYRYGELSVAKLAHHGYGFYREQVGVWAMRREVNARRVAYLLSGADVPPEEEEAEDESSHLSVTELALFRALCEAMPNSLRPELTLCDCCWECAGAWAKDESCRVRRLRLAIDFLELLQPSPRLQHGMAVMIWSTVIRDNFQKLYALMNEQGVTGVALKERVLKRDVHVVESDLADYIVCVRELLKMLSEAVMEMGSDRLGIPVVQHLFEDCVHRFFQHSRINGRKSAKTQTLSELAAKYKLVNYHLVLHHIHLIIVMELQINVGLKSRVGALFDAVGQMALFSPLHSHPLIPLANVDDRTCRRRQQFLERVVECMNASGEYSSSVVASKAMADGRNGRNAEGTPSPSSYHSHNWALIISLANDWKLDVGSLQVKEVSMLYEWGLDREAETLMSKVSDKEALADALLPLVAARVKCLLKEEPRLRLKIVQRSAATESTLDYVNRTSDTFAPKFHDVRPAAIRRMVRQAVSIAKVKPPSTSSLKTRAKSPAAIARPPPGQASLSASMRLNLLKEFDEICAAAETIK